MFHISCSIHHMVTNNNKIRDRFVTGQGSDWGDWWSHPIDKPVQITSAGRYGRLSFARWAIVPQGREVRQAKPQYMSPRT